MPARFPSQIKYIVGNEGCERFSFYGMRSILVVYMVDHLGLAPEVAQARYHDFVSACYLLPLLGAFLSDRFLGKYRTIISLSIVYCAGHAVLAIRESETALYTGLALIALGSGGIKPCVSAHVGDQFTTENKDLVKKVFDLFYWMINFGSFFSTLLIPVVLVSFGPAWAFGIPGILMAAATVVFWMGRRQYVFVPPTGRNPHGFWLVVLDALRGRSPAGSRHWLDRARNRHPEAAVEGAKAALRVLGVFATVSVFWALFDQHGSSWVLQARQMDLDVDLGFWRARIEPAQMAALNPLLVMVLIPIFSSGVYPLLETRIRLTALRKMGAGMFVAALSFAVVAVLQLALDAGWRLPVSWQIVPYVLITVAEVLVSITGLEFAYTQAPRAMKSTIMSFWLLTVFAGNQITARVSELNTFSGAGFFAFFAVLMSAVGVIFAGVAWRYRVLEYMEDGTAPVGAALLPAAGGLRSAG